MGLSEVSGSREQVNITTLKLWTFSPVLWLEDEYEPCGQVTFFGGERGGEVLCWVFVMVKPKGIILQWDVQNNEETKLLYIITKKLSSF